MNKSLIRALLLLVMSLLTAFAGRAADNKPRFVHAYGNVRDSLTREYLPEAIVFLHKADGTLSDTIKTRQENYRWNRVLREVDTIQVSTFYFVVPANDSLFTYTVKCPGYIPRIVSHRLKKSDLEQQSVKLPPVMLEREPHQLGEVLVKASKIKFYHKGDTLVYNADAFHLQAGAMLDALIAQLPGVQLFETGEIKFNGQYVESLLLNGREFFNGDKKLMLQNIGAYTVKNVEVYEGQTLQEKWIGDSMAVKHLTMDVKLRKEYNRGYILNATAGYGTEDRYLGKLFASSFTNTLNLALVANLNNLNDNRNPGKNDSWRPEMMPSGTREFRNLAFNYTYRNMMETQDHNGYAKVEWDRLNSRTTTSRTNFLTAGDNYENAFARSTSRNLKLETRNYLNWYQKKTAEWLMALGRYIKKDNSSGSTSATFADEQNEVTQKAIEAIYDGNPGRLESVINRSITRTDGSSHEAEVQAYPDFTYKIFRKKGGDRIQTQLGLKYRESKEERWRDYLVNYGMEPEPAIRKRQYFDNSPNHRLTLDGYTGYHMNRNMFNLSFGYSYRFQDDEKDSYMYALDRLDDMGIYGTLPAAYLDTFDPDNSYTSRLIENKHDLSMTLTWYKVSPKKQFILRFHPEVSLLHQHLNYFRGGREYKVRESYWLTTLGNYDFNIEYRTGALDDRGRRFRHNIQFYTSLSTKTPDPTHRIDIINDSDPLNITEGNPDLHSAREVSPRLTWRFAPETHHLNNTVNINASYTWDALVRGFLYDTSTGVRRYRTYNVDGNRSLSGSNHFNMQFGPQDQFTVSSGTSATYTRYANMLGTDTTVPVFSAVDNTYLSEELSLGWMIGKHGITLNGGITNRHSTSTREDFNVIDAQHYRAGISGNISLPLGFGISTDFNYYARRGYGTPELDTTDLIWNLRLSYAPGKGRWVFTADGFDLLHQLTNVSYSVNDQARTVVFSNALPRYLLFTAQYRLNIQPKKKK